MRVCTVWLYQFAAVRNSFTYENASCTTARAGGALSACALHHRAWVLCIENMLQKVFFLLVGLNVLQLLHFILWLVEFARTCDGKPNKFRGTCVVFLLHLSQRHTYHRTDLPL